MEKGEKACNMFIHTIMPLDFIMAQPESQGQTCYKEINGVLLQGTQNEKGFCVDRVLSTDPSAYLQNDYQPGNILPLFNIEESSLPCKNKII